MTWLSIATLVAALTMGALFAFVVWRNHRLFKGVVDHPIDVSKGVNPPRHDSRSRRQIRERWGDGAGVDIGWDHKWDARPSE